MCLAVPGKLLEVTGDDPLTRMGKVSFGGVVKQVCLAGAPDAQPGEYVIVHAGFALGTIDEHEAGQVFEYLEQMADPEELRNKTQA